MAGVSGEKVLVHYEQGGIGLHQIVGKALLEEFACAAQRPNIIIRGSYLGKVEVWAVPTGTGITPDEYTLLGHAKRKTAAGRNEEWLFEVDCGSLLATRVFVTAFNRKGKNIGAKSLHYTWSK